MLEITARLPFTCGFLIAFGLQCAHAQPAADDRTILVYEPSVTGGAASTEAVQAQLLGYTVEIASPEQWAAKTAADFRSYRAIVLGDPTCSGDAESALGAPQSTTAVWGPAVTGNIIVIGTDPVYHQIGTGATRLIARGLAFAASGASTGAYITLSCYYHDVPAGTAVQVLSSFGPFTVEPQFDCPETSHVIEGHPSVSGVTDADVSNWGCSAHMSFLTWPASFVPTVISLDVPSSFVASDGTPGAPYVLARVSSPSMLAKQLLATVGGLKLTALGAKLKGIVAKIDRGNTSAACGQLRAFLNMVSAQRGKKLTERVALTLTFAATDIASALGCR